MVAMMPFKYIAEWARNGNFAATFLHTHTHITLFKTSERDVFFVMGDVKKVSIIHKNVKL